MENIAGYESLICTVCACSVCALPQTVVSVVGRLVVNAMCSGATACCDAYCIVRVYCTGPAGKFPPGQLDHARAIERTGVPSPTTPSRGNALRRIHGRRGRSGEAIDVVWWVTVATDNTYYLAHHCVDYIRNVDFSWCDVLWYTHWGPYWHVCPLVQVHLEEMDVEEETIKQRRRIYVSCNLWWWRGGGACDMAGGEPLNGVFGQLVSMRVH